MTRWKICLISYTYERSQQDSKQVYKQANSDYVTAQVSGILIITSRDLHVTCVSSVYFNCIEYRNMSSVLKWCQGDNTYLGHAVHTWFPRLSNTVKYLRGGGKQPWEKIDNRESDWLTSTHPLNRKVAVHVHVYLLLCAFHQNRQYTIVHVYMS